MRSMFWVPALSAVALAIASPAVATPTQQGTEESSAAQQQQLAGALSEIIAETERRMEAARDPVEKAFLSQLSGHYREYDAVPAWTNENGLTDAGRALYEELLHADLFGLDPARLGIPELPQAFASGASRAATEVDLSISAIRYAWHARGGRVTASQLSGWLDAAPKTIYAGDVFRALAANGGDPVAALRSFHPPHPQFERLRQAYLAARGDVEATPLPVLSPGSRIDQGMRHPDVVLIRQRLGAEVSDDADLLDRKLLRRIRSYLDENGYEAKRFVDDAVREALNRASPPARRGNREILDKFVVNMERWRTMPEDMGKLYVWNNLPEFQTRVVKNGEVIHQERIIIGKPNTQTPVFSDEMSHIIFQPEWGVPESIKLRQILPHMRGGDYGVLARRGMQIKDGERVINPARINWAKVDVRNVPIIQGAGPGNPLGRLKFMFPNHHDVYMHDTNDKYLFNDSERTFSHGCIRVRDPERFAEVILGEVAGWTPVQVTDQLKNKKSVRVDLPTRLPVHNTYLTTWVNPDGSVLQFKDVYGHDKRYSEALAGRSIQLIAARDPALALKKQNEELRNGYAVIMPVQTVVPPPPKFGWFGIPLQPPVKTKGKAPPKKAYSAAPAPEFRYLQP